MQQSARRDNRINNRQHLYTNSAYHGNAARRLDPQSSRRSNVTVVRGGASSNPSLQTVSSFGVFIFKALIACAVIIAFVFVARVWLSTSTVQALESIESLQSSVSDARTAGNQLEIEHSTLANPTRIQGEAKNIGMSYATSTERINIVIPASVKTFADGTISVSDTLSSIESQLASS